MSLLGEKTTRKGSHKWQGQEKKKKKVVCVPAYVHGEGRCSPALKARGTSSMVTPVEGVLLPSAVSSVGLATVTEGDVGSVARLDATAIVPGEGTVFIGTGDWVVLLGTVGGDNTVPGDEYGVLLRGEEEKGVGVAVGLGGVPKSVVPPSTLALCTVRGLGAVSKAGGTELKATGGLSAAATVLVGMEAGDNMATVPPLGSSTSAGPEDTSSLVGPVAVGGVGWWGAAAGTAVPPEPGPAAVPTTSGGVLAGARGEAVGSSPSPGREKNEG